MTDTVAGVLAEMRWHIKAQTFVSKSDNVGLIQGWADRIATAHEREVARLQTDLHDMIADRLAADALLRKCYPLVSAHAEASHLTDGFTRQPANEWDRLADAMAARLGPPR